MKITFEKDIGFIWGLLFYPSSYLGTENKEDMCHIYRVPYPKDLRVKRVKQGYVLGYVMEQFPFDDTINLINVDVMREHEPDWYPYFT